MKLIEPKVEVWEQITSDKKDIDVDTLLDMMWKHGERCTRVCYQSESKGEDPKDFMMRVIFHGDINKDNKDKVHGAMLEHMTVYLAIHKDIVSSEHFTAGDLYILMTNPYSRMVKHDDIRYITTNMRVIYENNLWGFLNYVTPCTEFHERRITISFITDIATSREINRSRSHSMSEESTRYCNYSKDKFGKELTFIKPAWFDKNWTLYPITNSYLFDRYELRDEHMDVVEYSAANTFIKALVYAEQCYFRLLKEGWKPQQARQVLPINTKSQVVHTAYYDEWVHFVKLRYEGVSGEPHPNIKVLAEQVYNLIIK